MQNTKTRSIKMYPTIWKAVAEYKQIMGIEGEPLDGDEVDMLCEEIKDIINRNEGNI